MTQTPTRPAECALAARIERAAHMTYLHGAREAEVAEALGIRPVTLREAQMRVAADRLAMLTERAVEAVAESLLSDNPTVRLKAATWVLERADLGLAPEEVTEFEMYVRRVRAGGG